MKRKRLQISASITIEAALVVPIFILAVYTFLHFFCILQVQEDLHYAASQTCETVSSYGGMLEDLLEEEDEIDKQNLLENMKEGVIDAAILQTMVYARLEHSKLADSCIRFGLLGVGFLGSSLSDSEDCITVVMSYYIKIPIAGFEWMSFPVTQRVSMRNFSGHYVASRLTKQEGEEEEGEEAEDPIVYITKNGSVYHRSSTCTYIRRNIASVLYSEIETKRNESGAKYYPCESCCKNAMQNPTAIVYITAYGTRYHSSSSCNQIERTVIEKRLSEVQGMRPCSKCGK